MSRHFAVLSGTVVRQITQARLGGRGARTRRCLLYTSRCVSETASEPHSATAQFFINLKDNDFLDYRSASAQGWCDCVFGQVVDGMDVVNAIAAVATTSRRGHQDVPTDDILIEKVEIVGQSPTP